MVRRCIATSTVAVLVGATALLATGARFAAATESAAGEARACDLLTTSEASQIIGVGVHDGVERKGTRGTECDWEATDPGAGGNETYPFTLKVTVLTGNRLANEYKKAKEAVATKNRRTVPHLGKDAFYAVYKNRPMSAVHVLVASNRVLNTEVTNYEVRDVVGLTLKDIENMQVAAAKLTVPRLKNA
jgi:hypothetical protein